MTDHHHESTTDAELLSRPLRLPCGVVLKNRIAKSAMSDSLGDGRGNPTSEQLRLYERWASGGLALSIIGETQPTPGFPEKPGNLVLGPSSDLEMFRALANRAARDGAQLWLQLGNAGALSHLPISAPEGPSALDLEGLRCAEMSLERVQELPAEFARAAALAQSLGFGGVQLHAAHGFLLSQFLSPLFNHRRDQYGGGIEARCRIVAEVAAAVRSAVGPAYPVGLKINSSDQLEGGLTEAESLAALRVLDRASLDLVDISGGTYFPGAKSASDSAGGGPYFADFAARARESTSTPLTVTGGVKTRAQAAEILRQGQADMVGLARSLILEPDLPSKWLGEAGGDPVFPRFQAPPVGGVTAWYTMRLTAIAEDRDAGFSLELEEAIRRYDARDEERAAVWREAFPIREGAMPS
ncbi:MAG: oxidoreductase [Rhodobacteraceae bacterium]|nr:oxidoreductase [Paracoccaceae bacterium]